jgi:type VI secretion system protein ImpA
MPSPAILDLDALTAAIPGDVPVGVNLRTDESADSIYYNLRALRQECRDEERQVDAGNIEPVPPTKWEELARGCEDALREKTKDLEICCWLIEALARIPREAASPPVSEFAALRDGFKLANALCTQYWDTLYSVEDESDPDAKSRPLVGLNEGALIAPISKIPLTKREHPGPFAFWQIKVQQEKNQTGEVDAMARQGGRAFYEPLLTDIAEARAALAALDETMRARMNATAANIDATLDEIQRMVQHISGIKLGDAAAAAAAGEGEGQAPAAARRAGGVRVDGGFASRDDALEALLTIARYFREREPQAPISYTIEDAVRRARMPLNELLGELLDEDSRRRMLLAAGIMPPKSE